MNYLEICFNFSIITGTLPENNCDGNNLDPTDCPRKLNSTQNPLEFCFTKCNVPTVSSVYPLNGFAEHFITISGYLIIRLYYSVFRAFNIFLLKKTTIKQTLDTIFYLLIF
jgi:hypothetical protein